MSLSDKMWDETGKGDYLANTEDIKKAIKELKEVVIPIGNIIHPLTKEQLFQLSNVVNDEIDKIFGEKLIK